MKDKYGLSWQIVSPEWDEMLRDKDAAKSEGAMAAILQMSKPDLRQIRKAFAGEER